MAHLPPSVHAGVGAPGDRQRRRLVQAEHRRQRGLERSLHGAQPRLTCPPDEGAAVVRHVEADADEPAVPVVRGGGLVTVFGVVGPGELRAGKDGTGRGYDLPPASSPDSVSGTA